MAGHVRRAKVMRIIVVLVTVIRVGMLRCNLAPEDIVSTFPKTSRGVSLYIRASSAVATCLRALRQQHIRIER
jgi:hypothetical protein